MKTAKVVSAIVLPVLLVVAIHAISVHAAQPPKPPKPEPVLDYVLFEGDISGGGSPATGNPMGIAIEFTNTFVGTDEYGDPQDESGLHVANPDRPPALEVGGAGINRRLIYYYCTAETHTPSELDDHGRCSVTGHDPTFYRQLVINDGKFNRKTGLTVFPRGSSWTIWGKIILPDDSWDGWMVAEGILANDVTYQEFYK